MPAAALGPGMGSANDIWPARASRFVVAAAVLGPGMGVGEIEMCDHDPYQRLEREDGGLWCVFECLSILHLKHLVWKCILSRK